MSISAIIFTAVMWENIMLINWVRRALAALEIYCHSKMNWEDRPYLRLTAETKIDFPDGTSLGFKPPAFNSFKII